LPFLGDNLDAGFERYERRRRWKYFSHELPSFSASLGASFPMGIGGKWRGLRKKIVHFPLVASTFNDALHLCTFSCSKLELHTISGVYLSEHSKLLKAQNLSSYKICLPWFNITEQPLSKSV